MIIKLIDIITKSSEPIVKRNVNDVLLQQVIRLVPSAR